jgi:hypothetical protein
MQHAFDELWHHPELARLFPSFLILQNQITRASVPLMEAAHQESVRRAAADPVAAHLADYFAKHIEEERDHDVWTLDDLEAVGYTRDRVLGLTPLPGVASFVGSQYYWLRHHHPVMLMGYIAVLEGSPPSAAHIGRLKELTQLPDEAFRTYRYHGQVDPHHTDELNAFLDAAPLTKWHLGLIGMSATHSGAGLADCVRFMDVIGLSAAGLGDEKRPIVDWAD